MHFQLPSQEAELRVLENIVTAQGSITNKQLANQITYCIRNLHVFPRTWSLHWTLQARSFIPNLESRWNEDSDPYL